MKILVAEDEALTRTRLLAQLRGWGLEPVECQDGQQAWEVLQSPEAPPISILDWMMPHVDGVELCRRVRGLEHGAQNYLILLTGRDSSQDLVVGLESGADDYVTKPFEPVELRARLNVGLRLLEAQRQLADEVRQRVALQTAGAAAHELGQPLQVLLGNIGIVLEETNPDAPLHNSLTDMRSAVSRIAEIVKQMGTMRQVETKRYANRSDIIDFEGSAE